MVGALTADDGSVVLGGIVIVVHVGVAAQLKELLVAAVVGMAAPGAGRGEQADVARCGPSPAGSEP